MSGILCFIFASCHPLRIINYYLRTKDSQWRSQVPRWANHPPGGLKLLKKMKENWGKMRKNTGKWGKLRKNEKKYRKMRKIEEIFLSCSPGVESLATPLKAVQDDVSASYFQSRPSRPILKKCCKSYIEYYSIIHLILENCFRQLTWPQNWQFNVM